MKNGFLSVHDDLFNLSVRIKANLSGLFAAENIPDMERVCSIDQSQG